VGIDLDPVDGGACRRAEREIDLERLTDTRRDG
jgi:hypothetical protein